MEKIIIVRNSKKHNSKKTVDKIKEILSPAFDCVVAEKKSDACALIEKGAKLAICLGGDGTILGVAEAAAASNTPLLGINLGHLGYMAGLEANETQLVSKLLAGDYTTERRFMIKAEIHRKSGETETISALNEVYISRGERVKLVGLDLKCNGINVASYRADGIILSTPTGSTAYALSAGGSIIDPMLSLISVCPVCPHSFAGARSLVFSPDALLEIIPKHDYGCKIFLTADGKYAKEIFENETVTITGSPNYVTFVKLKDNAFYQTLYKKFNDMI